MLLIPWLAEAQFRVLFIGNSFTIGSGGGGVPGIFDRLAQAGGQPDPTTVMQAVGGTDYQFHSSDPAALAAIASQPWTHVILQNYSTEPTHLVDGSHSIADHLTYGAELYRRIMTNNPQTQVILFQTWSRAANHPLITGVSSPTSFASTDQFQSELRTNYQLLATLLNSNHPANPPVRVAPVGDAWQNAGGLRAESDPAFADLHGSDNYHGNNNGYYLAAAVFYSVIYGKSPEGLASHPLVSGLNLGLTESPAFLERIAWETVSAGATPTPQTFLFDFGAAAATTEMGPAPDDPLNHWNNVTAEIGGVDGGQLAGLVTIDNQATGAALVMVNRFNGANTSGTTASGNFPQDATRDSLFGNTEPFSGLSNIFPGFKLTGLNTGLTYSFTFYASRTGVADNRETAYAVQGANSAVAALNAANNVDATATVVSIRPTAAGEISIDLSPTANNNNGNHFTYLGAMRTQAIPPQEPLVFTRQPISQAVMENDPVTFSVTVQGTLPYFVQWLSNGIPIANATQFALTIPSVGATMNGASYSVTVSNLLYSATSSNAILTVIRDELPPTVQSATSLDGLTIDLVFSEALAAVTANAPGNYRVNGGAVQTVSAVVSPDGKTVRITLGAPVSGSFTVAASGVTDLAGNSIAEGTTVTGQVSDVGIQPLLIDFGGGNTTTLGPAPDDPENYWNNVTTAVGASSSAQLNNLVTVANNPTPVGLVMLSRFNGANENGTTSPAPFPVDATRDSLFGNTETFSGLANIFPSFKLTGLNPALTYTLTFYASRTGVGDNRETGYTVQGAATNFATLNPANNVTNVAVVPAVRPTTAGEITISLAPTASNNNANHFTYLGVLRVDPVRPSAVFPAPALVAGQVILNWTGPGRLEWAPTVNGPWTRIEPAPSAPYAEAAGAGDRFFRLTNP